VEKAAGVFIATNSDDGDDDDDAGIPTPIPSPDPSPDRRASSGEPLRGYWSPH
jgi:hypothetical protein